MKTPTKLPTKPKMVYRLEILFKTRDLVEGSDYTTLTFTTSDVPGGDVDVYELVTKKGLTKHGRDGTISRLEAEKLWASRVRAGYYLDEAYRLEEEDL